MHEGQEQGGRSGEADQRRSKDGDSVFEPWEAVLILSGGSVSSLNPFPLAMLFSFPDYTDLVFLI